jgi:hypothetical protein
MAAVRAQFLDIDFSNDELKEAFRADLSKVESNITGFQTGGDTFCYWMLYDFDLIRDYAKQFCLIKKGEFPLYDVNIRIRDMDRSIDILEEEWGNINSPAVFKLVEWSLPTHAYYRVFFSARNGQ